MDARGRKLRTDGDYQAAFDDAGQAKLMPFASLADADLLSELLSVPQDDDTQTAVIEPALDSDNAKPQQKMSSGYLHRASPTQSPLYMKSLPPPPPPSLSKKRPLYASDYNDPSKSPEGATINGDAKTNGTPVAPEDKPKRRKPVGMMAKCFNCNETGHAVSDCKYARNFQNIRRNREMHAMLKRTGGSGNNQRVLSLNESATSQQDLPFEDYADTNDQLQTPNTIAISAELASALSYTDIRYRVPPFLYNMRRLGYPPAYVEAAQEKQLVFVNFENDAKNASEKPTQVDVKKLVNIQGLTSPISAHEKATREDDRRRNPRLYDESSKRFPEIDRRYQPQAPTPRHGSVMPISSLGPVLWAAEYRNSKLEEYWNSQQQQKSSPPNGLLSASAVEHDSSGLDYSMAEDADAHNRSRSADERKKRRKELKLQKVIEKLHGSHTDSSISAEISENVTELVTDDLDIAPKGAAVGKREKRRRKNKSAVVAESNEPPKTSSPEELEEGEISSKSNSSKSSATTSPSAPGSRSSALGVTPPRPNNTTSPQPTLVKTPEPTEILPDEANMVSENSTPAKAGVTTPVPISKDEDIISIQSFSSMKLGTYSNVNALPSFDAFAKGVTSHISYENLPNTGGRFKRIMELVTMKNNKTAAVANGGSGAAAVVVETSSVTIVKHKTELNQQQHRDKSRSRSKRDESVEFVSSSHKTIVKQSQRPVTPKRHHGGGKSTADWRYK